MEPSTARCSVGEPQAAQYWSMIRQSPETQRPARPIMASGGPDVALAASAYAEDRPGIRHLADGNGDQCWLVSAQRFFDRRPQLFRRLGFPTSDSEGLSKREVVRIQQVGGDCAAAELLLLNATYVAKGVVSKDDGDGRDPVHSHRRKLVQAESEAAISIDGHHWPVRMCDLRSQRRREAISKCALVTGSDIGARLVNWEGKIRPVANLC